MKRALILVPAALLASCAGGLGWVARDPAFAALRPWPVLGALAAALVFAGLLLAVSRRAPSVPTRRAAILLACLAPLVAVSSEARFQFDRWRVLTAAPEELAELGPHVIAGYRSVDAIRPLVERGAIGGLFISAQNVRGRTAEAIACEIAMLQTIQQRAGRRPLWIAADQEGGLVSRLSPPLSPQPSLRRFATAGAGSLADEVAAYARLQGDGLAALGVNLNFSPVVDLDFSVVDVSDRYTRITERAIGRDPAVVVEIAGRYCTHLAERGVRCTLKHFPGLGRVRGDTHVGSASLTAAIAELGAADWVPFRRLAGPAAGPMIMLAHVTVPALDPAVPASISKPVVDGLIRTAWRHDGLLVTDDLCMGAIYYRAGGLRAGAVAALDAGVDLLLVSWDGEQVYKVLSALISARRAGRIDARALSASRARLQAAPAQALGHARN